MAASFNLDAGRETTARPAARGPLLVVEGLDVYYGRAHALQGVGFTLPRGVLGIVGRNGMGKTTLCNAICGLVPARGSVRLAGEEILGLPPHQITRRGIAYVPQGRRVWPSLSVEETLRLVARQRRDIDRVYAMFPKLAERKGHGGAQLSGGEQQMLAIGRALLLAPRLLVMDEPTEGLAPVIVEQVAEALGELSGEDEIAVLLIEQNLGVAIDVADRIGVMVNGRIAQELPAAELGADRGLQERLLGVRAASDEEAGVPPPTPADAPEGEPRVLTVRRAYAEGAPTLDAPAPRTVRGFNRWNAGGNAAPVADIAAPLAAATSAGLPPRGEQRSSGQAAQVFDFPVAASSGRAAYVAGTFDTKGRELYFLRQCLEKLGLRVVTVDLSTSGKPSTAAVHPREVARHHPEGEAAVFSGDRGSAVTAMALAFSRFVQTRGDLGGLLSAGGSGGTTLATAGHAGAAGRRAQGDGLDHGQRRHPALRRAERHLHDVFGDRRAGHPPHQRAGAGQRRACAGRDDRPPADALGRQQAGPRPHHVRRHHALRAGGGEAPRGRVRLPRLPCHRRRRPVDGKARRLGPAGRRDRRLHHRDRRRDRSAACSRPGPTRLDVFARRPLPYVGSCGALDMVNFGAWDTVPERFKGRRLYRHNPTVTLMRTTVDECRAIGAFLADKLNAMTGPVRFLLPEGGVSSIDRPGQPFHDPEADRALFETIDAALSRRRRPEARPPAAEHQRRGLRRRPGRRLARGRGERRATPTFRPHHAPNR